jgi:hypothetical protein
VCSSLLDGEEHHPEHRETLFLSLHFFAQTLDIFMLVLYHCLWVEYGPVCVFLVFHQACQGGHFLGARFVGVGVGVLLEPCDLSDDDDGDDRASDVCIRFSAISDMKSRNDLRELGLFC